MLPGLERPSGQVVVRVYRRRDDDRVDGGIGEHALKPGGHARVGITPAILTQALWIEVADPPDAGVDIVAEHPQQVRPPIPQADDRHANLVGRGSEVLIDF